MPEIGRIGKAFEHLIKGGHFARLFVGYSGGYIAIIVYQSLTFGVYLVYLTKNYTIKIGKKDLYGTRAETQ